MKTLIVIGENLHENLLLAITSEINNPALSFAINVKFIENGGIQEARLVLHSKKELRRKGLGNYILSFTGTIVTKDDSRRPCTGCYYMDRPIEECWITIIEPESEICKINISKTEFIKKCKEYYRSQSLEFTEEGNLINGFPLFRKERKPEDPYGFFKTANGSIEAYTELHNNLFPILKNKGGKNEVDFGEFIDENTIRICSRDEAFLRGVSIS